MERILRKQINSNKHRFEIKVVTLRHQSSTRPLIRNVLRFVEQVARDGSIRKAAENLHIASSAVNRQIAALEEQLGVQLFERMPRGMRLNAAGELLLSYVRRWEGESMRLLQQLDELQHGGLSTVRLTVTESIVDSIVSPVLARIRERMPRIRFDVETGDSAWVVEQIQAGQTDAGIAFNVPRRRGVRIRGKLGYRMHVVMTPNHPLASKPSLSMRDCESFPLIFPSDRWLADSVFYDALAARANDFNIIARTSRSSAIRALARTGLGLAFLSPMEVAYEVEHELLRCVPLDDASIPSGWLYLLVPEKASVTSGAAYAIERLRTDVFEDQRVEGE